MKSQRQVTQGNGNPYQSCTSIVMSAQSGCCLHPNDTMFGITKGIISPSNSSYELQSQPTFLKSTNLIDMVIAHVVGRAIRSLDEVRWRIPSRNLLLSI
ncbi:hypothetical protein BDE02_06G213200 [Populus trichocarpa]|nr:hypothetical protein BDE02_06G213200 [Populus trichocarpa]